MFRVCKHGMGWKEIYVIHQMSVRLKKQTSVKVSILGSLLKAKILNTGIISTRMPLFFFSFFSISLTYITFKCLDSNLKEIYKYKRLIHFSVLTYAMAISVLYTRKLHVSYKIVIEI